MTKQKHPTARPQFADPKALRLAPNVRIASVSDEEQEAFDLSIATHGVQSPLLVREAADGIIEVVAGQRRLASALKADLSLVPIHFATIADEQIRTFQLVENLDRSDMNPLDIAAAVWDIYNNEAGGSASLVAEMLNRPKGWVSKMMRLGADLPDRGNKVARGLMLANLLTDAEMAYTLCQIEELSAADAKRIGDEITAYSRADREHTAALDTYGAVPADATDEVKAAATVEYEKARDTLAKCTAHNRRTLREALKQIQVAAEGLPDAEPAGSGNGEDGGGSDGESDAAVYVPEREDYEMLAHILKEAAVPAKWLERLAAMRANVDKKLAGFGG